MSSNRLFNILCNEGGACHDGAVEFRGLTMKAGLKRATFSQLRWYVRNVLKDADTARVVWNTYYGMSDDGTRHDGTNNPRKAKRLLRERIRRAHPSLRRA